MLPSRNTVIFAEGACEARSRSEKEAILDIDLSSRLDLGSVALATNITVFMEVST